MHADARLLDLWEGASGRRGAQREHVLLGEAPRSLPQRNLAALRRHAELFGTAVELIGRCPHCGTAVEFTVDADRCTDTLVADAAESPPPAQWHVLGNVDAAIRFRLPTPDDLDALQAIDDADAFADAMLARCVDGGIPADQALRDAIAGRMQELLPGATLDFALQCPDCRYAWRAPLDPVELLWRTLRSRAERLLVEVALIAQRFGWSEGDILALGPVRRAAYLQLAGA